MWHLSIIIATAATALASATLLPRSDTGCCFHATASGGLGGGVQQLLDGQNRIGQSGLNDGQFCLGNTGGLTDNHGRGCIITPPTKQWQCDAGANPTPGFAVDFEGGLSHNGSHEFFACPTGDYGGWNIYTEALMGEPNCTPIGLKADNCKASKLGEPAPMPVSQCPMHLPMQFEFPHLIVPIDSDKPNVSYGTSYNGTAGDTISSIFNFDIPASAKGKTCSLHFLFPTQTQLETSAYTFAGKGSFRFAALNEPALQSTTFATSPKVAQDFGSYLLTPGSAVEIASMGCPAGKRLGIWWHAMEDSCLDYFQDYNPCPIGLYITVT